MDSETFLTLINNMALLLLLGLAYDLLYSPSRNSKTLSRLIGTGFILSGIGIIVMLLPWEFRSGIIIDTRSILLSISGLFFGLIPTAITVVTTIILRIFQGGAGVLTGMLVIIFSAAAGLLWSHAGKNNPRKFSFSSFYSLGLIVHIIILLIMLTLPGDAGIAILKQISIPVLVIYPFGTVLLGFLLKMRMEQIEFSAQLEESKEKLQVTFRSIGDGVITTDTNGYVDMINTAAEKLTGWDLDTAKGQPLEKIFPIYHTKTGKKVENPAKQVLETGLVVGLANHTKLISRKGEEYQIADSGAPIKNEKGETIGVVLVFRNVTEEYNMRDKLEISENLYKTIFQNTGAATCILENDGIISLANSNFAALSGYSIEELEGKKRWMEFTASEDLKRMKKQHTLRRTDREKALMEYEFNFVDKNNQIKNIHLFIDIIPDTNRSVASLIDITDHKRTEQELRKNLGLLSSLFDSIPDLLYYKNCKGEYLGCNQSFETFAGRPEKEIIGKTDFDLFVESTASFFHFHDKNMLEGMHPVRYEEWITYPEGEEVLLDTLKTPYKTKDGHLLGLLGIGRDITARTKANEEKENLIKQLQHIQKLESIGRLAGGVAHDFNNMLSVITGFTDLSLDQIEEDNPIYAHLSEVKNAAQRSVDITKKLLAFARKQNIEPKKIELNKTLENMLNMLRRLIGENIKLDWVPDDKLWPIQADPSQIDQIITNLCINGRDAIKGKGEISIETKNVSLDEGYCADHVGFLPGDFVVITVTDNGCGMDKETQSNIFEPFFTTKGVGAGSGLGLSTVYGIVKQNKGFINLYSEIGGGTSFRIYLPRYTDSSKASEPNPHHAIPKGNRESILIVEDEQSIKMLTKWMLEKLNYSVIVADSAENAISIAENHDKSIDMLITDVVMPEMNGRDLSERLKKVVPQLKVLYMSGYTANVIVHKGILEKGLHFMQKPFSQFDIAAKVRETLDDREKKV